jgi:hypothetical protein
MNVSRLMRSLVLMLHGALSAPNRLQTACRGPAIRTSLSLERET